MSIFEETVGASYAGVSFLMMKSNIEGGRKDTVNEFPNSDLQTIEDLGKRPRRYSIEAVINQDSLAENYKQRRDEFLRVLEKGGRDVLIHPLYGRIDNIVVRSFTLNESFNELGEAKFSIIFAIDNSSGSPIVSGDTLSVVDNSVSQSISAVSTYAAANFSVSNSFPSNFTNAVSKVNDMVEAFEENTSFLQVSADGIDEFSAELVEFRSNVTALISSPSGLVNSIGQLFGTINGLYDDASSTYEVMSRFYSFGDDDVEIVETTSGLVERARNNNILNQLIKSQALLLNYGNASQIDFTTISEVSEFSQSLETQYQSILSSGAFDSATMGSITDTRNNVQKFFDQEKLSARQITSVRTPTLPSRVISYNYYGDSSQGFDIAEINEDANVSFISGDIEVFTE